MSVGLAYVLPQFRPDLKPEAHKLKIYSIYRVGWYLSNVLSNPPPTTSFGFDLLPNFCGCPLVYEVILPKKSEVVKMKNHLIATAISFRDTYPAACCGVVHSSGPKLPKLFDRLNTMKKFLIALSFTLCACTPDTQADDQYQKAESLVVKGLHLGMNADEVKMAVEQQLSGLFQNCEIEHGPPHTGETGATEQHGMVRCRGKDDINNSYYILDRIKFANQKLIEFKFHSSNIETIFNSKGVSRLDFVKAFYDYYKLKIYFPNLADSTKLDHNQRSSFEKNENAYCLVGYGAMECNNSNYQRIPPECHGGVSVG